jgi:hypothetical protein
MVQTQTHRWVRPGFPTLYVVVFFMFTDLRSEVIVYFVDIGGIDDHHCLRFHFINKVKTNYFFLCWANPRHDTETNIQLG